MSVSYVEREQADAETTAFYDKAEDRFQALLNIFKVFGHQPEYGTVFTDMIMAILKDGVLDWKTKDRIQDLAAIRSQPLSRVPQSPIQRRSFEPRSP